MVTGEKPSGPDKEINDLDDLIKSVKSKSEVTKSYMRQWERDLSLQMETSKKNAITLINTCHELGANDSYIREKLTNEFEFPDDVINELFKQVNNHN